MHILSGGIRLNVSGNNLDSVSNPLIRSVVKIWNGNRTAYMNESFAVNIDIVSLIFTLT